MSLQYPVIEKISLEVVTRLQAIEISSGYQVDIGEVLRPTRVGNVGTLNYAVSDLLAVVEQGTRSIVDMTDGVPATVDLEQVFNIALYRVCSDGETVPIDTKVNVFQADAEKALTLGLTPTANWEAFIVAGVHLAVNARMGDPQYFTVPEQQAAGVVLSLAVTYRHPHNDPYTSSVN